MMHGGSIDCTERLSVPGYMVYKFGNYKFILSHISDMGFVHLPPVIKDFLQFFVRTFKERSIIHIPSGIFPVILFGKLENVYHRFGCFLAGTGKKQEHRYHLCQESVSGGWHWIRFEPKVGIRDPSMAEL
jgi:hypothetical protein